MTEIYSVLGIFLLFFICWIVPALYNYLNIKSYYYHELFIHLKEQNKIRYPELYIPLKDKIKKFFRKENKK